jgi:hypothetical protein
VTERSARARWTAALAAAAIVGIWLFTQTPEYAYHWDELQLARGAVEFDLERHEPHPPGYYLFVKAASLLVAASVDSLAAVRLVALASVMGWVALVVFFVPPGASLRARVGWAAYIVGLTLTCTTWTVFGVAGLSYTSEALAFSAVLLVLARVEPGGRAQLASFAAVGLAAGVRPTILPWCLGVLALVWVRDRSWLPMRRWPLAAVAGAGGVLMWWGPMVLESGGLDAYRDATRALLEGNVLRKSVFVEGITGRWLSRFPFMAPHVLRALGPIVPLMAVAIWVRARRPALVRSLDTLPFGALMAMLTYALVIYDQEGYILAVAAPLMAWTVWVLARAHGEGVVSGARLSIVGSLAVLATAAIPDDARTHYSDSDAAMETRLGIIRGLDPRTTVIAFSIEHWHFGLRHAGHYLPEYASVQLLRDRFFAIVEPETKPYLVNRSGRVEARGPAQLPLASLTESGNVRHVVLGEVTYLKQFVHPVCARFAARLEVDASSQMALFTLPPGVEAWIDHEWLVCGSESLGQAPPYEHGLDQIR